MEQHDFRPYQRVSKKVFECAGPTFSTRIVNPTKLNLSNLPLETGKPCNECFGGKITPSQSFYLP